MTPPTSISRRQLRRQVLLAQALAFLGGFLIALAIIFNEFLLTALLSRDGEIDPANKNILRIVQLLTLVLGLGSLLGGRVLAVRIVNILSGPGLTAAVLRRLLALGLGCSLALLAVAASEIAFWTVNSNDMSKRRASGIQNDVERDEAFVYRPRPNSTVSAHFFYDDELIYDVEYHIDDLRRRVTPASNPAQASEHALFFGGSYTMGTGVRDSETLPSRFGESSPNFQAYNYGLGGYGPQQMLAHLQRPGFADEIYQKNGIAVYVMITSHIGRAVGSIGTLRWTSDFPLYTVDDARHLSTDGSFANSAPLRTKLFLALGKSHTLRFFNVDYPTRFRKSHFELLATMIEESSKRYHSMFPDGRFYLLIFPASPECRGVVPYLSDSDVRIFDYAALVRMSPPEYAFPYDTHPTAKAHEALARQLAADIERIES